jgi:hypothetical protein
MQVVERKDRFVTVTVTVTWDLAVSLISTLAAGRESSARGNAS